MVLSTAIPIVIAAIVIVIISSGIDKYPIIPKINDDAKIFGIIGVVLASINIFGGFIVTYRMLSMFKKKPKKEQKD